MADTFKEHHCATAHSHYEEVPYQINRPKGGFRPLESFTDAEKEALYSFALVLACLDGNAFVNRENPENDMVLQYIPEVSETLEANGVLEWATKGVVKARSLRRQIPWSDI